MENNPHVSHPSPYGAATTTLRPERTQAYVLGSVDSVLYCIADLVYSLRGQLTYGASSAQGQNVNPCYLVTVLANEVTMQSDGRKVTALFVVARVRKCTWTCDLLTAGDVG